MKMIGRVFLATVLMLCVGTNALDVTIGLTDCSGCTNYYKASTTDAYPVVQTALDALKSASGGKMTFLAGTYILSKPMELRSSNIIVEGAGMDSTTLKLKDYASPFRYAGLIRVTIWQVSACKNYVVRSLTIDGNKAKQNYDSSSLYGRYGLYTEGCENVLFDNVKVQNWQGYGFDPHGWKTKNVYGKNLTITNCVSQWNDWDGFTLDQTDGMVIKNNIALNNGRHGFNVVTGSRNVVMENLQTSNNGFYDPKGSPGCGVMIQNNGGFGTRSVSVTNSFLSGDKRAGICINGVYAITGQSNKIKRPDASVCLYATNSWSSSFSNNLCETTGTKFETLKNCTSISLSSNTIGPLPLR